jgi:hypothetical protein
MHGSTACEAVGGVSSFGFSGTIAHAVMAFIPADGARAARSDAFPLLYRRATFSWWELSGPSFSGGSVSTEPVDLGSAVVVPPQLDADMPFMEAGLTSVGVARFTARIRSHTAGEIEITPTIVFEQPTARAMAAHLIEVAGRDNPKVPSANVLIARIADVLVETIAIGGGGGIGDEVQMSPTRVADSLILCAPDRSGHSIPPLIAAPMMNGSGKPFAQLGRHVKSSLYYCEHPILHDGRKISEADYFHQYARAIQAECLITLWNTFDLIGASFGGYNAYRISLAAVGIGFAPRAIVQLDPVPPRADVRVMVDTDRSWKVQCAVGFLSIQLGMVYHMSGRAEQGAEMVATLPDLVATWPTEEIAIRATDLLSREGVRGFSLADVSIVHRHLVAFEDGQRMLASGLDNSSLPSSTPCETLLVLCTNRDQFFAYGMSMMHLSLSSSGFSRARDYGNITCELLVEGNHLLTCEKCSSGENATFNQTAQSFLDHSDQESSAQWQLRTLARTPVLPFETHEAHMQGYATSVMLHGPPVIDKPLSTSILFVLSNERSGSSLLQLCLQCHSSLYAGQELYLLPFSSLHERCIHLPFEMKEGLLKNVMELRPCSFEDAYLWLGELERQKTPTFHMYKTLQELCDPRILVDKTPHNADHANFLQHAHAIFASSAKYCHLIRHPYTCIASGVELRRDLCSNPNVSWQEVEHAYIRLQKNVHEFFNAYLDAAKVNRTVQVRYEDLLRRPAFTLTRICKLAGLEFQSGMDEPYDDSSVVASFQAASLMASVDPKLLKRKKIDPGQADKWRKVKLPQPLHEDTEALALAYGYELKSKHALDSSTKRARDSSPDHARDGAPVHGAPVDGVPDSVHYHHWQTLISAHDPAPDGAPVDEDTGTSPPAEDVSMVSVFGEAIVSQPLDSSSLFR